MNEQLPDSRCSKSRNDNSNQDNLSSLDWKQQLRNRITTIEQLGKIVNLTVEEKRALQYINQKIESNTYKSESVQYFRMAITPYFASLIDKNDFYCPIRRQCIPLLDEFKTSINELNDPCGEEKDSVIPELVHRYPDRVLLIVTDMCATYCRHCTRRRIVGSSEAVMSEKNFELTVKYISENTKIRDVLLSGGDPLLLPDTRLDFFIKKLREIKTVEIIRIGTRVPVTLPQRITYELCEILKQYHPLYMNIHFNHYKEITDETAKACNMLSDAGIPLGSQTVLLKNINDKPNVMMKLMHELLKIRVRPYYIYQCDLARGTEHFRTSISTGIKIIQSLRGFTTGYAVPTFVVDAPGGGGKIPINPEYIIAKTRKGTILKNYENKLFVYPENGSKVTDTEVEKILTSGRR